MAQSLSPLWLAWEFHSLGSELNIRVSVAEHRRRGETRSLRAPVGAVLVLTRYVHRFRGAAPSPAAAPAAMNLQWAPDPSVGWRLKGSGVGLWPRLSQPDSSSWASEGERVNPKSKRRLEWGPCETGCSVTAIDTEKKHTQLSSAEKTVTGSQRAHGPALLCQHDRL